MTNDEIFNLIQKFNAARNLHNRFLQKIIVNQDDFFGCKFLVDIEELSLAIILDNIHFAAEWSLVQENNLIHMYEIKLEYMN